MRTHELFLLKFRILELFYSCPFACIFFFVKMAVITGYAKDADLRVKQYKRRVGARYTKLHRPKRLVYTEKIDIIGEAMKREREIKQLRHHEEKYRLISLHTR